MAKNSSRNNFSFIEIVFLATSFIYRICTPTCNCNIHGDLGGTREIDNKRKIISLRLLIAVEHKPTAFKNYHSTRYIT